MPIYGGHVRAFYEAAWRPANGWIATVACALHFVVIPSASAWLVAHGKPELPKFDLQQTIALLTLTLGISSLRTMEKWWGVDTPAGQAQQTVVIQNAEGGQ